MWRKDTKRFATGEIFSLGKWSVGTAFYDGHLSKSDSMKYAATCCLPGIKTNLGHFATADGAKAKVESAVEFWLSKAHEGLPSTLKEQAG